MLWKDGAGLNDHDRGTSSMSVCSPLTGEAEKGLSFSEENDGIDAELESDAADL